MRYMEVRKNKVCCQLLVVDFFVDKSIRFVEQRIWKENYRK